MEKGFWAVPKSITKRKDLGFRAKLITGILWSMKDSEFKSYPSRKYLAKSLGISTKTIDRGIKELKEKAGLKVKREGLRRNNRYHLPDWDNSSNLSILEKTDLGSPEKTDRSNPILIDNSNISTIVDDKKSSQLKNIISYFVKRVREIKGYTPEINWAKDGQLIKQRLKKYTQEQIEDLINWYLHSKHTERLGDSLAICLSTNIVNLWKASRVSHEFFLDKLYPTPRL